MYLLRCIEPSHRECDNFIGTSQPSLYLSREHSVLLYAARVGDGIADSYHPLRLRNIFHRMIGVSKTSFIVSVSHFSYLHFRAWQITPIKYGIVNRTDICDQ